MGVNQDEKEEVAKRASTLIQHDGTMRGRGGRGNFDKFEWLEATTVQDNVDGSGIKPLQRITPMAPNATW